MLLHKCLILFSVSQSIVVGTKCFKWSTNPIYLYFSVMNLFTDILLRVGITYKFPLLFVSWYVFNNPTFKTIITNLYKKIINNP